MVALSMLKCVNMLYKTIINKRRVLKIKIPNYHWLRVNVYYITHKHADNSCRVSFRFSFFRTNDLSFSRLKRNKLLLKLCTILRNYALSKAITSKLDIFVISMHITSGKLMMD